MLYATLLPEINRCKSMYRCSSRETRLAWVIHDRYWVSPLWILPDWCVTLQVTSLGSGLDSIYRAMFSRVLDISRYGPDIVSMLRRVLVTVLICEEPVTFDGVNLCCFVVRVNVVYLCDVVLRTERFVFLIIQFFLVWSINPRKIFKIRWICWGLSSWYLFLSVCPYNNSNTNFIYTSWFLKDPDNRGIYMINDIHQVLIMLVIPYFNFNFIFILTRKARTADFEWYTNP